MSKIYRVSGYIVDRGENDDKQSIIDTLNSNDLFIKKKYGSSCTSKKVKCLN